MVHPLVRSVQEAIPIRGPVVQGLRPDKYELFLEYRRHLKIHGGAIRWAPGAPDGKGGQIFALARDVGPSLGNQLVGSSSQLLLGLTGIGAVASVANLAVSAVGFYVVNKKLNALQEQMNSVQKDIHGLSRDISIGFSEVNERLIQIQYLIGASHDSLFRGQEEIKDQNDAQIISPIHAVIEGIREFEERRETPSISRSEGWIDSLRGSQKQLEYLATRWCTGQKPANSAGFARGTGYFKIWGLAIIAEARLMRMMGQTLEASEMIYRRLGEWYYPTIQKTVDILLDFEPGILLASPFEGTINTDHYFNIMELLEGSLLDGAKGARWASMAEEDQRYLLGDSPRERLERVRSIDVNSKYARAVEAYSLIELGKRINTLGNEYEICARNDLSFQQWEQAQLEDEASGEVHLIPLV